MSSVTLLTDLPEFSLIGVDLANVESSRPGMSAGSSVSLTSPSVGELPLHSGGSSRNLSDDSPFLRRGHHHVAAAVVAVVVVAAALFGYPSVKL